MSYFSIDYTFKPTAMQHQPDLSHASEYIHTLSFRRTRTEPSFGLGGKRCIARHAANFAPAWSTLSADGYSTLTALFRVHKSNVQDSRHL